MATTHHRIGRSDQGQTGGVPAERAHRSVQDAATGRHGEPEVADGPAGDLRPVLEQKQQHEDGQDRPDHHAACRTEQGSQDPRHQQPDHVVSRTDELVRGSLERVGPVLDLLHRAFQLSPDLVTLAGEPADDDGDRSHDQGQRQDEHKSRPEPPRNTPPREPVDERDQDGRQDGGDRQRDRHLGNERDEEQREGEYGGDAQREPCLDAEGSQPRGGFEARDPALCRCSDTPLR
jgi:hypothetical protein